MRAQRRLKGRGASTNRVRLMSQSVLYAPSINYDAPTFDEQRYQNETEPEHASRTQLVVSKLPVVT